MPALLLFLLCFQLHATPIQQEQIDLTVEKAMQAFQIPGASIGICMDGKVIHMKGYGKREDGTQNAVTPDTPFAIGSCTKAFTALILAQLVEEGKASWDDPVKQYLPDFALADAETSKAITLRDLIAHRTGLERHDVLWINQKISQDEAVTLLKHLSPRYSLRQEFQYNNLMYSVAGLVIEKITGNSWEKEVQSRCFAPLGMHHSSCSIASVPSHADCAKPHASIHSKLVMLETFDPAAINPAGGIYSSAVDLLAWGKMHLSNNQIVLSLQEMQMPFRNPSKWNDEIIQEGYGLGWYLGNYRGNRWVFHSGSIHGFFSDLTLLPEKKIAIVILCNNGSEGHYFIQALRHQLVDQLLGIEDSDHLIKAETLWKNAKEQIQSVVATYDQLAGNQPSLQILNEYQGDYIHPSYGKLTVAFDNSRLTARIGTMSIPLYYQSKDVFLGKIDLLNVYGANPIFILTAKRDHEGKMTALDVPFESFRKAEPVTFTK